MRLTWWLLRLAVDVGVNADFHEVVICHTQGQSGLLLDTVPAEKTAHLSRSWQGRASESVTHSSRSGGLLAKLSARAGPRLRAAPSPDFPVFLGSEQGGPSAGVKGASEFDQRKGPGDSNNPS